MLHEVAVFLGGDDFAHELHSGIVFARIFVAFSLHRGFAKSEIGRFEHNDQAIATGRGMHSARNITHGRNEKLSLAEGKVKASRGVTLRGDLCASIKDIGKRYGFAGRGIDHTAYDTLPKSEREEGEPSQKKNEESFH